MSEVDSGKVIATLAGVAGSVRDTITIVNAYGKNFTNWVTSITGELNEVRAWSMSQLEADFLVNEFGEDAAIPVLRAYTHVYEIGYDLEDDNQAVLYSCSTLAKFLEGWELTLGDSISTLKHDTNINTVLGGLENDYLLGHRLDKAESDFFNNVTGLPSVACLHKWVQRALTLSEPDFVNSRVLDRAYSHTLNVAELLRVYDNSFAYCRCPTDSDNDIPRLINDLGVEFQDMFTSVLGF